MKEQSAVIYDGRVWFYLYMVFVFYVLLGMLLAMVRLPSLHCWLTHCAMHVMLQKKTVPGIVFSSDTAAMHFATSGDCCHVLAVRYLLHSMKQGS